MKAISGALSKLYVPFELKMNSNFQRLEKDNIDWIKSFKPSEKYLKKAEAINSSIMGGRAYHQASLEKIQLSSQWILWVLLADDMIDENDLSLSPDQIKARLSNYVDIIDQQTLPDNPTFLEHMIFDIGVRLHNMAPKSFIRRFLTSMEHFHEGCVDEARYRSSQETLSLSLSEYIEVRKKSVGMLQAFDLLEFCFDEYLSLQIVHDPDFLNLRLCAGLCTAWSNDFFSFEKETMSSDENTNLIFVLKSEHNCDLEEAVKLAIAIHNEEIENFMRLSDDVIKKYQGNELINHYVDGLKSWISGAFDWSCKTFRYKSDAHLFGELTRSAPKGQYINMLQDNKFVIQNEY